MLACVLAATTMATSATPTVPTDAPVLFGYDVVEYFNLEAGAPGVLGSDAFAANITGQDLSNSTEKMTDTEYTFYFKSAANQQAFLNDPWRYAPKYGGF